MALVLVVILFGIVGVLLVKASRVHDAAQARLGVPGGASVVSVDAGPKIDAAGIKAATLRDDEWGLVGKPDLLLEEAHGPVPVEWKRADAAPRVLRPSHQLQLGTYLALCEADPKVNRRSQYGLVQYLDHEGRLLPNGRFKVFNTEILRRQVIETAQAMRRALSAGTVHRNHTVAAKCRKCSVKAACGEALA